MYLGHISINVSSLERAEEFYSLLGLRVVSRFDEYIFLEGEKGILGLRRRPPGFEPGQQVLDHFGFLVSDRAALEALRARLAARGHTVTQIIDHRDGYTSFYSFDPDGNKIQFLIERE